MGTHAILFDLFNTLISGADDERAATVRQMGADLGVDPEKFVELMVEVWRDRMTGALGDLAAQCRTLAQRLGGDPADAQVAAAVERRLAYARRSMVVPPETLEVLAELRAAGWGLGIVSNCTQDSGVVLAELPLAAAVDTIVLSYEVQVAKPDPRIYEKACGALGVKPTGCVYVGDGADRELYGAWALGMRVYQATQFAKHDRDWSGVKIASLAELPALVSKIEWDG